MKIKITVEEYDNHWAFPGTDHQQKAIDGKPQQVSHLLDHELLRVPFASF